jgi:hypothetical protein
MEAEGWLKGVEKKLMIDQCTECEKILFAAHQLFGTAANWWETYYNTHANNTPSRGTSSRLISVPTMCLVAP